MGNELITVREGYDGQVTEITLGPAPANIVTAKMMGEVSDQLKRNLEDPHKKLIVFAGEGEHFSFGASVEEHKPEQVAGMLPVFHRLISELIQYPVPTLAKVRGLCLGGGFELALACNFIFTAETARFAVPEIQLGVLPPVASVLLPLRCGSALASQFILTGEQFPAELLFRHGLVNEVAEAGALDDAVDAFFKKQLQPKSASSLRIATRGARMMLAEQYRAFIGRLEKLYLDELMATKDAVEGIQAFLEKRKPQWQNA